MSLNPPRSYNLNDSGLAQAGSVGGAPQTESLASQNFKHDEAVRREAGGNGLPMHQILSSGGPASGTSTEFNAQDDVGRGVVDEEDFNTVKRENTLGNHSS